MNRQTPTLETSFFSSKNFKRKDGLVLSRGRPSEVTREGGGRKTGLLPVLLVEAKKMWNVNPMEDFSKITSALVQFKQMHDWAEKHVKLCSICKRVGSSDCELAKSFRTKAMELEEKSFRMMMEGGF